MKYEFFHASIHSPAYIIPSFKGSCHACLSPASTNGQMVAPRCELQCNPGGRVICEAVLLSVRQENLRRWPADHVSRSVCHRTVMQQAGSRGAPEVINIPMVQSISLGDTLYVTGRRGHSLARLRQMCQAIFILVYPSYKQDETSIHIPLLWNTWYLNFKIWWTTSVLSE